MKSIVNLDELIRKTKEEAEKAKIVWESSEKKAKEIRERHAILVANAQKPRPAMNAWQLVISSNVAVSAAGIDAQNNGIKYREIMKKLASYEEQSNMEESARLEALRNKEEAESKSIENLPKDIIDAGLDGSRNAAVEMAMFWPTNVPEAGIRLAEGAGLGILNAYNNNDKTSASAPNQNLTVADCSEKAIKEKYLDRIQEGMTAGAIYEGGKGVVAGALSLNPVAAIVGGCAGAVSGAVKGGMVASIIALAEVGETQKACSTVKLDMK